MSGGRFDRERLLAAPRARFAHRRAVPFHHVDAAGIVFYARVLEWFHDLYVEALAAAGHPLPEALRERRWMAPLVHAAADYLIPMRHGDLVEIGLVAADTSETRLALGYAVRTADDRVAAVGTTVHVFVEHDGSSVSGAFTRRPMPPTLRAWFDALTGPG